MIIQAELSLYPLRQNNLSQPIKQFTDILKQENLELKQGTMSTVVMGDDVVLFGAVQKAMAQVMKDYQVVLTMKVSNACPVE